MASKERFFLDRMLEWFKIHRRAFPWREGEIDPFVSLVTELLLQRTKAASVAEFFPLILEKYATPAKTLDMDRNDIIKDIKVLGLQKRRTESLISLSKEIQQKFKGEVPGTEEELVQLKGVGKYIARAALCFSRDIPVSIVDGNVTRVFCRFFDMENKGDNRRNKHIWKKAQEIIDIQPRNVKEINWAILDFAALVCLPRKPKCDECPVGERCAFLAKA